ncbi:MAG: hypothetical protein AAFP98_11800 [Pseudomonadota bacterium]
MNDTPIRSDAADPRKTPAYKSKRRTVLVTPQPIGHMISPDQKPPKTSGRARLVLVWSRSDQVEKRRGEARRDRRQDRVFAPQCTSQGDSPIPSVDQPKHQLATVCDTTADDPPKIA